ncbi:rqh1, partial [Symbiodinium sp. KB8]
MSVTLHVSLISGRAASLEIRLDASISVLKQRVQSALAVGGGKLLDQRGVVLHGAATIEDSGLREGDALTFHVGQVRISACSAAAAAILEDGSVMSWGDAEFGADSSAVCSQLQNVVNIQAASDAFAAIIADGSVVSWGDEDGGGDCSAVQHQLKNVQKIQASLNAFAAILGDGSVVTWGNPEFGGDSRHVQEQLRNVSQVQANERAFAAIAGDGSVVTWGDVDYGGSTAGSVKIQLKSVQHIQASESAFAAILYDGTVATWGDVWHGGDCSFVQEQLYEVQRIQAGSCAFAAMLEDGSVVTWGDMEYGADSSAVQSLLQDVQEIQASHTAFAAILGDRSVVTWGSSDRGGDCSAVQEQLHDVQCIQTTGHAFAALRVDGSVVTWGHAQKGGDSSAAQDQLTKVQQLQASEGAFAAILEDRSVVAWGLADYGGDDSELYDLQDVEQLQACERGFAAVRGDGCIVTWGDPVCGRPVRHLSARGLTAAALHSELPAAEKEAILTAIAPDPKKAKGKGAKGHTTAAPKLLYLSPELATSPSFAAVLKRCADRIAIVAIDEAHCVSKWGHDFRPCYRCLRQLRSLIPSSVPWAACTATATAQVRADVARNLDLKGSPVAEVILPFDRCNLRYSVITRARRMGEFEELLELTAAQPEEDTGIIYCQRKQDCEYVAQMLKDRGIPAMPFHAGLSKVQKQAAFTAFLGPTKRSGTVQLQLGQSEPSGPPEKARVLVATIAFGMGVDKADVRFVFHATPPKSLSAYYQESGRGGRDGQPALCAMFCSRKDFANARQLLSVRRGPDAADAEEIALHELQAVEEYCNAGEPCRRQTLLKHFGDPSAAKVQACPDLCCDRCATASGGTL